MLHMKVHLTEVKPTQLTVYGHLTTVDNIDLITLYEYTDNRELTEASSKYPEDHILYIKYRKNKIFI